MTLRQALFSFTGRIGRMAYFGYFFVLCIFMAVFGAGAALVAKTGDGGAIVGGLMMIAMGIAYLWAGMAITVKRLHDINLSGLYLIGFYGIAIAAFALTQVNATVSILLYVAQAMIGLYIVFAPGTQGSNRFGPAPGTVTPVVPPYATTAA